VSDVVLTNADADHVGGLMSLREGHRFSIHGTPEVLAIVAGNPIFGVLDPGLVRRVPLDPGQSRELKCGLRVETFVVPGKVPLYLEGGGPVTNERSNATVGAEISAEGRQFFYIPGCAEIDEDVARRLRNADLAFFDGTLWTDDEMIATGTGTKTGRRMGHMPVSGPEGSLRRLKELQIRRLVFIHINNTNPMLVAGSVEQQAVAAAGAEVGFDGQEIVL
jgi:pyrroloquinoline quinone biosynthesis protein B